jgi:O-methyltransferase
MGHLYSRLSSFVSKLAGFTSRTKQHAHDLTMVGANYYGDGLAVWNKNVEFLSDPNFIRAYNLAADSGHLFGQRGEKIKIEWRVNTALWAAQQAVRLEGDFVECGVNTGILSLAICNYLDFKSVSKHLYLFDTYSGIPEDKPNYAESVENIRLKNKYYFDCYEIAKKNFALWPNAHLIRGKVPDTLATVSIDKVSYLSLDMNVAEPEIAALTHFWPKLVSGAIVLIDDYGWETCEQQKAAVDAFAMEADTPVLFLPTGQGIIVKR